jgi:hypothetical protein
MTIMDNWDDLRTDIYDNMQLKTTEELRSILEEHDREAWSDLAFEIVKEILIKRTGEVPQIPAQQNRPPENSEYWKSVDWKKVYRKSQRELEKRANFAIAGLTVVFFLMLILFFSLGGLTLDYVLLLLFMGFLGWSFLFRSRRRKENRFLFEARIYFKHISISHRSSNTWVEINILNAFEITPDGQILETKDWMGHHRVLFPDKLYDDVQQEDKVNLLCRSHSIVLGKIEDYLDS